MNMFKKAFILFLIAGIFSISGCSYTCKKNCRCTSEDVSSETMEKEAESADAYIK